MPCPFYGRHAVELTRVLIDSHGNECALITAAYSPCRMETAGDTPDLARCELNGTARAIELATFCRLGKFPPYPD